MDKITFEVEIKAPKQKVWEVMLGDKTYREWTAAFQEGSYFEGSWDKGSKINFLADDEGKPSGMCSKIVENTPYEYVSIEHLGEVKNGVEDTESESAKMWAGSHENYIFIEDAGITKLTIELEGNWASVSMYKEMFEGMWPKALQKLKEMCEANS